MKFNNNIKLFHIIIKWNNNYIIKLFYIKI